MTKRHHGDPRQGERRADGTARDIADNTELVVAFGGIGTKNAQVEPGGAGEGWNVTDPDKVLKIQKGYAICVRQNFEASLLTTSQ